MTLVTIFAAAACASPPKTTAPSGTAPTATPTPSASRGAASALEPDAAARDANAAPQPASATLLQFRRVLDAPVHSLALGEKSRVAALGSDAWLDRGSGFEKLAPPPKPSKTVQIYFGRDNLPRLMGYVQNGDKIESVYFRFRGGWERAASELGRLGSTSGALYGVLGFADPEVVCKPAEQCIIKRRSGWTTIAAPPGLPRVVLCGTEPWAFEQKAVLSLGESGWQALGGALPFSEPSALWATSASDIWVAESARGLLHHFDGSAWTKQVSPIDGPRALWAASAGEIWLAGDSGVARYDGRQWLRAAGAPERGLVVTGSGSHEIWIGGAAGVWRGTRP